MATLTVTRQQEIDEKVDKIRRETGLSYPKDNLLDIAEKLGVKVYYLDLSEFSKSNKGVNGIIKWSEKPEEESKAEIYINNDYSSERKRFTLAHELGHFILHPNEEKLRVDTYDYSKGTQDSSDETEANYFAASLLMPRDEFENVLKVADGDVKTVAKYFGVSSHAAETRLQWIQTN
ncbi:MAG: ImmA/IrrE family metallo-endopeptidase [Candidatus Sungiibacteriota bacterium]